MLGLALVAVMALSAVVAAAAQLVASSPSVPGAELAISLAVGCVCALGATGLRTGKSFRPSLLRDGNAIRVHRARQLLASGFVLKTSLPRIRGSVFTQRKFAPRSKESSTKEAAQRDVQLQYNAQIDCKSLIICPALA
jgi:hypothetical protein